MSDSPESGTQAGYNRFLLIVAGLGGLLYGIDIGIIDPALGYLGKTISMTEEDKSIIVAAVMGGSMLASVIAGFFADLMGRKLMILVSAVMFVASVAIIFTSQSYIPLLLGRLLQGMSGGVIAVVVPLYLAECLKADVRGKGTSIFQFMLTFGIVVAAFVGDHYIRNAEAAIKLAGGDQEAVLAAANHAWRGMFLSVIYPGILFLVGGFFLSESPRWLYRKGRKDRARTAMLRSRNVAETDFELAELEAALAHEHGKPKVSVIESFREIFTQRKYIVPFIIACVILGCNQATGINSILGFMTTILQQAGLAAEAASQSGLWIKILNCVMTVVAVMLVDKKGRKFLLKLGTGGIIVSLLLGSAVFHSFESKRVDVAEKVRTMIVDNKLTLDLVSADLGKVVDPGKPMQISVLYAYGAKQGIAVGISNDPKVSAIAISLPESDKENAGKPLEILRAKAGPVPTSQTGILVAICLAVFIAFFSVGPGVVVWLALSELMPTRIRSVGMGFALLINQGVSTGIAAFFLPIVGHYGYSAMFGFWAACTVVYFITAAFFLPETKGRTLEEIEEYFEGKKPEVCLTFSSEVPAAKDMQVAAGGHPKGCRIGFDLGASDYKVSAVIDGEAVFTEETPWDPKNQANPEYHYHHISAALHRAAACIPRVDAIGGSSAGIIIDNEIRVASLLRAIPKKRFPHAAAVFKRIRKEWNVPLVVMNDGDVTALASALIDRFQEYVRNKISARLGTA